MAKTISANTGEILLGTTNASYNPLTVLAGVSVAGSVNGIYGYSNLAWNVTNHGTVSGFSANGVELAGGGTVTNDGSITGAVNGVYVFGGAASIDNSGIIIGSEANSDGVHLAGGGTVTNEIAASIAGLAWGVYIAGNHATTIVDRGHCPAPPELCISATPMAMSSPSIRGR